MMMIAFSFTVISSLCDGNATGLLVLLLPNVKIEREREERLGRRTLLGRKLYHTMRTDPRGRAAPSAAKVLSRPAAAACFARSVRRVERVNSVGEQLPRRACALSCFFERERLGRATPHPSFLARSS